MREYIIADNQDISKAGMMFLLSKQKDVATLLEADNKAELIQQLRLYPQAVVVLDYTLFDFAGADELIVLQERFKEVDWILFSDELSINFLRQVLFSSMAFGVVMKDNSKEEIMTAIQCAGRKQRYICNHVSNLLLSGAASPVAGTMTEDHLLTQTEKNILKEIALGKTTKEIAAEKNLSFHTINSHRKNIFRKLGVNNVHEATKYAMREGLWIWRNIISKNNLLHGVNPCKKLFIRFPHSPRKPAQPHHKQLRTVRGQCPVSFQKTRYETASLLPAQVSLS